MDDRDYLIAKQACVKAAAELFHGTGDTAGFIGAAKTAIELVCGGQTVQQAVHAVQTTPPTAPLTHSGPNCPECGGMMWDNRPKKASGEFKSTAPDYKCKNKSCGGVIWPPKDVA